jgi:OOP family OmpA-OmpF porin
MLALPLAANAAPPVNGLYVSIGAGANFLQDERITVPGASALLSSKVGPVVVLGMGWGFGNGLRAELEGDFRANFFNGVKGIPGVNGASGTEQKYGGMVNALYDFDVAPWVSPYVGVGIGYQAVHERGFGVGNGVATPTANATRGAFAYQGIAGAAFPIDGAPGLSMTLEYRFMGLAGDRDYRVGGTTVTSTNDYNHSVLIGVRYAFGATSTVTQQTTVVPAAAVARSYLVFFDWDKYNLSDRARGIISDAASNSAKVAYTKIDVNGNADTSGSHVYNQGLSMRRAVAVAAELVKDGVPKSAIAITASGDTHLLVPTGPGVREPQNRRVEIVIR